MKNKKLTAKSLKEFHSAEWTGDELMKFSADRPKMYMRDNQSLFYRHSNDLWMSYHYLGKEIFGNLIQKFQLSVWLQMKQTVSDIVRKRTEGKKK